MPVGFRSQQDRTRLDYDVFDLWGPEPPQTPHDQADYHRLKQRVADEWPRFVAAYRQRFGQDPPDPAA